MSLVKSEIRNPKSEFNGSPAVPTSPNAAASSAAKEGADRSIGSSGPRSSLELEWAKGRGQMAAGVTVQQVHWSEDLAWLRAVMADKDQPATVRSAAEKRLRALARKKTRL